jgi:hypothetical protein
LKKIEREKGEVKTKGGSIKRGETIQAEEGRRIFVVSLCLLCA